jgi:hypothetical protein
VQFATAWMAPARPSPGIYDPRGTSELVLNVHNRCVLLVRNGSRIPTRVPLPNGRGESIFLLQESERAAYITKEESQRIIGINRH